MSDWKEVSGPDRESAIEEAVRLLGVAEADLEIEEVADEDETVLRVRTRDEGDDEGPPAVDADEDAGADLEPASDASDAEADAESESEAESEAEEEDEVDREELLEQQKDVVLDFLVDLLEAFDLEGEIAADTKNNVLNIDINGDDLGSLIGRRGKTLSALAEVTRTVIQRRTAARVRLNLDVQGYRVRRREVLERYAGQLAREVQESSVEKALEPMPASERKIVHDVVADVDGVRSYSEGTEPKRNVVISPA